VVLTTNPQLAPTLKKEQSYTSTPPLDIRGLFEGELYCITMIVSDFNNLVVPFTFLYYRLKMAETVSRNMS
jgi:hypothetical protein